MKRRTRYKVVGAYLLPRHPEELAKYIIDLSNKHVGENKRVDFIYDNEDGVALELSYDTPMTESELAAAETIARTQRAIRLEMYKDLKGEFGDEA